MFTMVISTTERSCTVTMTSFDVNSYTLPPYSHIDLHTHTHTRTHTHTHMHTCIKHTQSEHDSSVNAVSVSEDGLRILVGTSAVSQKSIMFEFYRSRMIITYNM